MMWLDISIGSVCIYTGQTEFGCIMVSRASRERVCERVWKCFILNPLLRKLTMTVFSQTVYQD